MTDGLERGAADSAAKHVEYRVQRGLVSEPGSAARNEAGGWRGADAAQMRGRDALWKRARIRITAVAC